MSTAALWSGWQAFRSGPLPGPLAPATPSPVGGPVDQLTFHSSTAHYNFYYPANHVTLGIEPGLLDEVTAHVEADFALLEGWFGTSYPAITGVDVQIYDDALGGSTFIVDNGGGDYTLTITIGDNNFPYPDTLRAMILHETGHIFEWQSDLADGLTAADDTGWCFDSDRAGSRGEVLCRFLHSTFLADQLGAAGTRWLDASNYGVASRWLNSARTDYVNTAATSTTSPGPITGCGVLFLYWLRDQLGYSIAQIIDAGRTADTLADIYHTLSGDAADPFPRFKGLLDGAYPSQVRSGVTGENPENPWPVGAAILTDTLPGTVLIVQAAWGADPAIDADLWSWDDITRDVRQSDGNTITISAGRTDEADTTTPAQATMLLDNRDGRYALGGQNPLYPFLRRNTPIRVSASLDYGITWTTLFFGYADGWSPDWDLTGRDAVTRLSASGVLRRLLQGDPPAVSPYRRFIEADLDYLPVAYWPMEDGEGASTFAPAIGQYSMLTNPAFDTPKAAADSGFISSGPLPTVGDCELFGAVPVYPYTGQVSVTAMVGFPDSGIDDRQPLLFLDVTGSSDWWWIEYGTGGVLYVMCEDRYGTSKVADAWAFGIDGARGLMQLTLTRSGADVLYGLTWLDEGSTAVLAGTGTCTSRTLGRVQSINLNTHIDSVDDGVDPPEVIAPSSAEITIGHVTVRATSLPLATDSVAKVLSGNDGDGTGNRLTRVSDETDQVVDVQPYPWLPATPAATEVDLMGPQTNAAPLDLLREIEAVDGGILFDGYGQGLSYLSRAGRLSRPADLTLDVEQGHLLDPFHPDDDDRYTTNRVTVKRTAGPEVTVEDVDGPVGSATVGLYDSSATVNTHTEAGALQHAAWRVHLGTLPGYRYPAIVFDLAKSPELAPDWVGCPVGARIDVDNLLDARTQHPGGGLSLGLEGFTQEIDQKRWVVTANCSLFDPWLTVQVPPTVGDSDGPDQADTSGTVLSQFTAVGAAELRVTVTTGPDWTTDPADYPTTLDVGGQPVTVSGCTPAEVIAGAAPIPVAYQLFDDFTDNVVDTVLWPNNVGTVAESGGVAQVTAVAAGTFSYYESDDIYTLADSTLSGQVSPPSLASSAWAYGSLAMYAPASGFTTYAQLYGQVETGPVYTLGLLAKVNGQTAIDKLADWDPLTYTWVRLREEAGTLHAEVSADGVRWESYFTATTPVALRESTTLTVDLEARRAAGAADGTPAMFDNVTLTSTSRRSQTFTVGGGTNSMLTAKPARAAVQLWRPPTLAL